MNVCSNGNLAQMPGIHFVVLLTPKKKVALPLDLTLFCFISNIAVSCFTRLQTNSLTTTNYKSIKEDYKHIYNVTYLYMLHVGICKITMCFHYYVQR